MTSTSPVYCFISAGNMHCIPVTSFTDNSIASISMTNSSNDSSDSDNELVPRKESKSIKMSIKHKNLLFSLHNPSLSDLTSSNKKDVTLSPPLTSEEESAQISTILDNYSTHAIYLPQFQINLSENVDSDYIQIKKLLSKVFPTTWNNKSNITIKRLTGGITNMLLSCNYADPTTHFNHTVLMRVYGQGTNLIIDRHREFVSHLVLNSLHLAPTIHARFANGLIYGFLPGRSLEYNELKHPKLFPLIAQQLGNWHNKIKSDYIDDGVGKLNNYTLLLKSSNKKQKLDPNNNPKKAVITSIWDLIEDWIKNVPTTQGLIDSFNENNNTNEVDKSNLKSYIKKEFDWLKSTLNKSVKSPIVSSHCDLLSGNIIVPNSDEYSEANLAKSFNDEPIKLKDDVSNPIQFIDYEYMLPAPRAFDIANHLAEYQGFDCDRLAVPEASFTNPFLIEWCRGYLSNELDSNNSDKNDRLIHDLLNEIISYYGMPGFYWGIWASIQSEISNIDFNYSNYSKLRLQEYWDWKEKFTQSLNL